MNFFVILTTQFDDFNERLSHTWSQIFIYEIDFLLIVFAIFYLRSRNR